MPKAAGLQPRIRLAALLSYKDAATSMQDSAIAGWHIKAGPGQCTG